MHEENIHAHYCESISGLQHEEDFIYCRRQFVKPKAPCMGKLPKKKEFMTMQNLSLQQALTILVR